MDKHQLTQYKLTRNAASDDLLLLATGTLRYKRILSNAFEELYFSRTFEDSYGSYDWGTYIKGADKETTIALNKLCDEFKSVILIVDDLDQCFALSFHTQTSALGSYEKTEVGKLVRTAKSYGNEPGNKPAAKKLARMMCDFLEAHPRYANADMLLSIPGSNTSKAFDLPRLIGEEICKEANLVNANSAVKKIRATKPMKDCDTMAEKVDNIKDAFSVQANIVKDKTVLIIDDIYHSGLSMNELARTLFNAGASEVLGLTATKTFRDLPDDS